MIVWMTLLSFFVWDELADRITLAGIALIIGSAIYVLRREAVDQRNSLAAAGLTGADDLRQRWLLTPGLAMLDPGLTD